MATTRLHPLLQLMQGAVGEIVFKRYGKRVIISRKPEFKDRVFTEAQKANQERFRQAAMYARTAMADPNTRHVYDKRSRKTGRPAYNLMMADFLHAPTVDKIDLTKYNGQAGDKILILATDDFEVTRVEVAISDAAGTILEQGVAVPAAKGMWNYTCELAISLEIEANVVVRAFDRASNRGTLSATKGAG